MSRWSIVYIEGSLVTIATNIFCKDQFVLATSADPDEIPQSAAF